MVLAFLTIVSMPGLDLKNEMNTIVMLGSVEPSLDKDDVLEGVDEGGLLQLGDDLVLGGVS